MMKVTSSNMYPWSAPIGPSPLLKNTKAPTEYIIMPQSYQLIIVSQCDIYIESIRTQWFEVRKHINTKPGLYHNLAMH